MSTAPLLDALGVAWDLGAPVVDAAWDVDDRTVGFALGDGHLAVADTRWTQGPRVESRPGGGVAVVPGREPAHPPRRAACHPGACLSLAADRQGGFLTGGDDGRVVHVPRKDAPTVLAHLRGTWIDVLACSAAGVRAFGGGRRIYCVGPDNGRRLEAPAPVTAIAFDPAGRTLAAAHGGGATLWQIDDAAAEPRHLLWHGYHRALAWSPQGDYLVTAMQENALHGWRIADGGDIEMGGYPGQPLSLSFAHDGRYLATSGAGRAVCWGFDPPGAAAGPAECGIASKTPVSRVACHPQQRLIAAGYHHGAVVLCQPGSGEALFVRGMGGGAVNALCWSADGGRLAFGTQEGMAGWLSLPASLFRSRTSASASASASASPIETETSP